MLNVGNREVTVKHVLSALVGAVTLLGSAPSIAQTTLTIATVNNGDMIRMQGLTNEFTAKNPDIAVTWETLEENALRQRLTTDIATKGAQFDEKWQPEFDMPEWKKTLTTYVDLMKVAGPPGASSNGFNENLALFNSGKCGMWIDATVAASFVTNPKESTVADKVGFALAPNTGLGKNANWLWAWSLAVPAGAP